MSAGDLASVLINEVGELFDVEDERGSGVGLADFFSLGGEHLLWLPEPEPAASDSELVTMGLPCAACWRTLARLFLNHTWTLDSGRLIFKATSSLMKISGYLVFWNRVSSTSNCCLVKVVLSLLCFLDPIGFP